MEDLTSRQILDQIRAGDNSHISILLTDLLDRLERLEGSRVDEPAALEEPPKKTLPKRKRGRWFK